jgi:hypothetical protein
MSGRKLALAGVSVIMCAGLIALSQDSAAGTESTPSRDGNPASLTYPRLLTALAQGKDVTIVTSFAQCTAADTGKAGPAVVGGLHINAFLSSPGNNIAFSDTHVALDAQNRQVTEYIRYTVTTDDIVTVNTTALAADGHVLQASTYRCAIGHGASFASHDR